MKVGIIGIGNMGSVIADALGEKGYELILSSRGEISEKYKKENISLTDNISLAQNSDYIILAVKPNMYPSLIAEIKEYIDNQVFISIAAGQSLEKLEKLLGDKKIVLTMPNTAAKVGESMTAICPNKNIQKNDLDNILKIFGSFGKTILLDEDKFDGFGALAGCLPAYVFIFMEALADAGVYTGLKRDMAYEIIGQTVMGSSKMLLESRKHPAILKDMVTSPGGTTIEGLKLLEEKGFRGICIDAILAAYEKSKNM